jgi:hypothetical protein
MKTYLLRACTGRHAVWLSVLPVLYAGLHEPVAAQNLSNAGNLTFGTFAAPSSGTLSVAANGVRTSSGGVVALNHGTAATAAQFTLHGKANAVYAVTLPAPNTVVMSDGAGHNVTVASFVSSLTGTDILSKNGNGAFSIGATLSVGALQSRGNYSGTFSVIVNYQ